MVKRWLQNKNVPYTEKSLDDNIDYASEAFEKSGLQMVPVITVGEQVVSGANIGLLSKLLMV
jgi:glutaredoxin